MPKLFDPPDPIRAIVNAARLVAQQKLEEAADGKLSRVHAFGAVMALEAAHAYLKLWGPPSPPPQRMVHIRVGHQQHLHCNAPGSSHHTRSEHGEN